MLSKHTSPIRKKRKKHVDQIYASGWGSKQRRACDWFPSAPYRAMRSHGNEVNTRLFLGAV